MRAPIIRTILGREGTEILRNRMLLFSIFLPPLILTALPIVLLKLELGNVGRIPASTLAQIVAAHPAWADLAPQELAAAFTVQEFLNLFLILPAYIPIAIASYSIVGEKQTRSLEAVLATPIRTTELLTGKALAALIPGVLTAWAGYIVMVTIAALILSPRLVGVLVEPQWLAAVFALGPAIGLVSVAAGVIVSSRVNDPRAAQQVGAVIILPIVGLVIVQTTGAFVLGPRDYVVLAVVVGALGLIGLRLGARIFGRETILTRWK